MYAQIENKEKSPFKFHRAYEITISSCVLQFRKETHNKTNKQTPRRFNVTRVKNKQKKKKSDGNILSKIEVLINRVAFCFSLIIFSFFVVTPGLLFSLVWPGACCIDKAGLELIKTCLSQSQRG